MKITHISPEYPPYSGGIGSYVFNLTNYLAEHEASIEIFTPFLESKTTQIEKSKKNIKVNRINYNIEVKSEKINFLLLKKLKEIHSDLIHIHGHLSFFSLNGAILSKWKKIPLIITHHGDGVITGLISKITRKIRDEFGKKIFQQASGVICVNKSEIPNLETKYKIPSDKIQFIPNCPTPKKYAVNEKEAEKLLGPLYKNDYLLYVGFLYEWKNPVLLVKVIKEIVKNQPTIQLVMVGSGPDENKIRSLINHWDLKDNIILLKFVSEKLLTYLYDKAKIFLFPSIYDVSPTVLLDAMNHSKPVVAHAIPSVMELIIDEKNGFLIPINHIEMYKEKILYLLENKDIQKEYGLYSKKIIDKYYNWNKVGAQILQLYKNVLAL